MKKKTKGKKVVQKKKEEQKVADTCEGYGIAFSNSDDECLKCSESEECLKLTNSENAPDEEDVVDAEVDDIDVVDDELEPSGTDDPYELLSNKVVELAESVEALEIKIAAMSGPGKPAGTVGGGSKKASKAEKDEMKKALLDGAPYKKEELESFSGRTIKQLASALTINSFGKKKDAVVTLILNTQKKAATQKGKKKKSALKK